MDKQSTNNANLNGALTAATQDATDTDPQAILRFDGLYIAEEYAGKTNDYITGALVDSHRKYFLRFCPNGRVFSTSHVFPVTTPANPMFTPERVFVKLGEATPAQGGLYILTDHTVSFGGYMGTIDGLSLLLSWSLAPDPYSGEEGEIVTRHFQFLQIRTHD